MRLTVAIALFSVMKVSNMQMQSWEMSNILGFFESGTKFKSAADTGAQDECLINSTLLDDQNIKDTREEAEKCNEITISCDSAKDSKYRTMDGTCNNLEHPYWGKSDLCLKRILPFNYADDKSVPKASCTGEPLPNPRHISIIFHQPTGLVYNDYTTHFMEWGQMVAHDLSLNDMFRTPESGYVRLLSCCPNGPVIDDKCFSIPVPPSDTFYPNFNTSSISFVRTTPCTCHADGVSKRYHWNQNTAYHDLSLTYGSTYEKAENLRSKEGGMLRVEYNKKSGSLPPTVSIEENCESPGNETMCYHAGDARCNQTPFLLTVHTYLLRHHNYICKELQKVNPHWDDEKLYQEARRINIAIAQYITYGEYLPNVLGVNLMKQDECLGILNGASYTKYDATLEASIFDEFAAFAARYGHTQVPNNITEINPMTHRRNTIRLRDYFYTPFGFKNGQYEKIMKGMSHDKAMERDQFLGVDVRNYLHRRLYLNESFGIDLAALSIIRGRDHGLPGYTYYLKHLLNITVHGFDDLRSSKLISDADLNILQGLYKSVHDIDPYSAGLAENHVSGALVGPTLAAVLEMQYKRLKCGDRYWFEHGNQAGSFTPDQLLEIKGSSLGVRVGSQSFKVNPLTRILCVTSKSRHMQANVFFPSPMLNSRNPVVPCQAIPKFNFKLWEEKI